MHIRTFKTTFGKGKRDLLSLSGVKSTTQPIFANDGVYTK